jgi:hypothetical protein
MKEDTYGYEGEPGQGDAYWRRRAVTLAAGLGLLGLLAWAFSGGGGKPVPTAPMPKASQASGVLPAAAYSGPPSPAGAGGGSSSSAAAGGRSPSPSAAGSSPTASRSARPAASGRATPSASPAVNAPAGPGGRCLPSTLVLSLFTSRPAYYGGQDPEFGVYAVSTAARRCVLDLGPGKLDVVVMSSGRVIWDSADCARGGSSRVAELSRGVPARESVVWNRAVTLPGCVTLATARAGTYQVQARAGAVASPVRSFRLVR